MLAAFSDQRKLFKQLQHSVSFRNCRTAAAICIERLATDVFKTGAISGSLIQEFALSTALFSRDLFGSLSNQEKKSSHKPFNTQYTEMGDCKDFEVLKLFILIRRVGLITLISACNIRMDLFSELRNSNKLPYNANKTTEMLELNRKLPRHRQTERHSQRLALKTIN